MAKQLTVFLENRPGRVKSVSDILVENNLNIWAFTIQDRGDFGLIKMIVDKPDTAKQVIVEHGMACVLKEVVAVAAKDQPGNLDKLTTALMEKNVNIKDAYGFASSNEKKGICFFEFDNPDNIDLEEVVTSSGFSFITEAELYEL